MDQLLWRIYNTCHCAAVFGAMPGGQARKDNLVAFYTYARQMAGAGKKSLFDFVTHLRTLLENGDAPDLSTRQSAGGVQIMSIHKSKGLEFPIVFLCDLSKRFDPRDTRSNISICTDCLAFLIGQSAFFTGAYGWFAMILCWVNPMRQCHCVARYNSNFRYSR